MSLTELVDMDGRMTHCTLCRGAGAYVECYHHSCKKVYCLRCALFTKRHVRFGDKDPYKPEPSCPNHAFTTMKQTQFVLVTSIDESKDLDSRKILKSELRDPDDPDEENLEAGKGIKVKIPRRSQS